MERRTPNKGNDERGDCEKLASCLCELCHIKFVEVFLAMPFAKLKQDQIIFVFYLNNKKVCLQELKRLPPSMLSVLLASRGLFTVMCLILVARISVLFLLAQLRRQHVIPDIHQQDRQLQHALVDLGLRQPLHSVYPEEEVAACS